MDSHASTRKSRIPHPRPTTASGLQEMSESLRNSLPQSSVITASTYMGTKRPAPEHQSQPEAKRAIRIEGHDEHNGKNSSIGARPAAIAPSTALLRGKSMTTLVTKSLIQANSSVAMNSARATLSQSTGIGRRTQGSFTRPTTTSVQYNRESTTHVPPTDLRTNVLDVDERLREVESQFSGLKDVMNQSFSERKSLEELLDQAKTRADDLQRQRNQLEEKNLTFQADLDSIRLQLQSATVEIEQERRERNYQLEDQTHQYRQKLDDLRLELERKSAKMRHRYCDELEDLKRKHRTELEDEKKITSEEIGKITAKSVAEQQYLHLMICEKEQELRISHTALDELRRDLCQESCMKNALHRQLEESSTMRTELEGRVRALLAQVDFLKSDSKQQSDQFSDMEARMQQAIQLAEDARQKLVKEETERRILFNKYQELKGNIRVMCRVRPTDESPRGGNSHIYYPDTTTASSQIEVTGPEERNSLGVVSRKTVPFEFDRVFGPDVLNDEVFGEISQMVQSALDGYNVCIFCYGQTGSGKTYTMSSHDGMIPRATRMIYESIRHLREKSWDYAMGGSFIEVYNEELNDLLGGSAGTMGGKDSDARKKLEIRHDEARKSTTVVNCKTVQLDSVEKVESMLRLAQRNRSVAATKANERSSRSHSVFILKLVGENATTGERCEGTLNLVDLAGSERLKQSGAEGERMKETQNINRSLSCLGDVIEALGRGAPHVPYRNSKLTHLLQYSLGGNSKTLMFVMVSPLEAHLKETITSLRFATKVYNTHIGTAKSTKRAKDRGKEV